MKEQLEQLLIESNINKDTISRVIDTYKEAYRLVLKNKEDYSNVGNSRVGGLPDLPLNYEYPLSKNGYLLQFVAQINLADLEYEVIKNLPKTGILYFFQLLDDEYDYKVLYFNGKLTELRQFEPKNQFEFHEFGEPFPAFKLDFELIATIDSNLLHTLIVEEFGTEIFDKDSYKRLNHLFLDDRRIGGNPQWISTSPLVSAIMEKGNLTTLECQLFGHDFHLEGKDTFERWTYWDERLADDPNNEDLKSIVKNMEDLIDFYPIFVNNRSHYQNLLKKWHVLLVIDSIDECEMCWNDAGLLTFCVNEDDLAINNFENVYSTVESS